MKYVFFGTPRFAEIVLGRLIDAHMPPIALVSNPDRPVGRKKVVRPPATKQRVLQSGNATIDILQPETLDEDFIKRLRALESDFFVVAAYAKIIPQAVLDIPRLGTLGVHPSLLPKYRGSSPIQSVILAGDADTGVTLYRMDAKMDHGPIVAQISCPAGSGLTKYRDLEASLAERSAKLLTEIIPMAEKKIAQGVPQDDTAATYTKKFGAADGFIDEADIEAAERGDTERAERIVRMVNALNPEPGVWTKEKDGKRLKVLDAAMEHGSLRILKVQREGGRPMER